MCHKLGQQYVSVHIRDKVDKPDGGDPIAATEGADKNPIIMYSRIVHLIKSVSLTVAEIPTTIGGAAKRVDAVKTYLPQIAAVLAADPVYFGIRVETCVSAFTLREAFVKAE